MTEKKKEILRQLLQIIQKEETESFNFLLPKFISKVISTYMSIREDILLAQRQILLLLDYQNIEYKALEPIFYDSIRPAFWFSVVVTYGRCFTDASKVSKSKLEIKDCNLNEKPELLRTHEFLMDLRHNFVAHRGDTDNELTVVYMKIPKGELKGKTEYRIRSVRAITPATKELKNCLILFEHIQKVVERKLQIQTEKVHKRVLTDFDSLTMKSLLINSYSLE